MDGMTAAAGAISAYGLYFIVAVLGLVIYKLYAKTTSLEKEFRAYMARETAEAKSAHERLLSDSTNAMNASTSAIKDSTDVMRQIAMIMERMK